MTPRVKTKTQIYDQEIQNMPQRATLTTKPSKVPHSGPPSPWNMINSEMTQCPPHQNFSVKELCKMNFLWYVYKLLNVFYVINFSNRQPLLHNKHLLKHTQYLFLFSFPYLHDHMTWNRFPGTQAQFITLCLHLSHVSSFCNHCSGRNWVVHGQVTYTISRNTSKYQL